MCPGLPGQFLSMPPVSDSINNDSIHFLSIPVWKVNYVVVSLIPVLFSATRTSSGTRKAGGCVVKSVLWPLTLLASDVINIWV